MKPELRNGKGMPGIGGCKCYCCKTGMSHAKNRRIVRHRTKALVRKTVNDELS